MRLRIEVHDSPIKDYRIQDGRVQVRVLDASGRPYPDSASEWITLDDKEIQRLHALGTVVSEWLRVRLGHGAPAQDEAA